MRLLAVSENRQPVRQRIQYRGFNLFRKMMKFPIRIRASPNFYFVFLIIFSLGLFCPTYGRVTRHLGKHHKAKFPAFKSQECIYKCPNSGISPVPHPEHVKSSNGCGLESIQVNFPLFDECCEQHDYCFDTCNAPKLDCDEKFSLCMTKQCRTLKGDEAKNCNAMVTLFKMALGLGESCQAYVNAQANACSCEHDEL